MYTRHQNPTNPIEKAKKEKKNLRDQVSNLAMKHRSFVIYKPSTHYFTKREEGVLQNQQQLRMDSRMLPDKRVTLIVYANRCPQFGIFGSPFLAFSFNWLASVYYLSFFHVPTQSGLISKCKHVVFLASFTHPTPILSVVGKAMRPPYQQPFSYVFILGSTTRSPFLFLSCWMVL